MFELCMLLAIIEAGTGENWLIWSEKEKKCKPTWLEYRDLLHASS